jgi:hypothetical protein
MAKSYRHKSNNALGAVIICGLFAAETAHISSTYPSPATPYIRLVLGVCTVVALGLFLHYRKKSKEADE